MEFPQKEFIFLRHGETDWNLEGKFQGQTDIPLNDNGRKQAEECVSLFRSLAIHKIFSSPLNRALSTAKIISSGQISEISCDPRLMECSSEETAKVIYSRLKVKEMPSFEFVKTKLFESPQEFIHRSMTAIADALKSESDRLMIVAHGGTFWAICENLGIEPYKAPNCRPIRIIPNFNGGWRTEAISR